MKEKNYFRKNHIQFFIFLTITLLTLIFSPFINKMYICCYFIALMMAICSDYYLFVNICNVKINTQIAFKIIIEIIIATGMWVRSKYLFLYAGFVDYAHTICCLSSLVSIMLLLLINISNQIKDAEKIKIRKFIYFFVIIGIFRVINITAYMMSKSY